MVCLPLTGRFVIGKAGLVVYAGNVNALVLIPDRPLLGQSVKRDREGILIKRKCQITAVVLFDAVVMRNFYRKTPPA